MLSQNSCLKNPNHRGWSYHSLHQLKARRKVEEKHPVATKPEEPEKPVGQPKEPTTTFEKPKGPVVKPQEPTTTEPVDTSDWKTYRNEEYGFKVKYPNHWKPLVAGIESKEKSEDLLEWKMFKSERSPSYQLNVYVYSKVSGKLLSDWIAEELEHSNSLRYEKIEVSGMDAIQFYQRRVGGDLNFSEVFIDLPSVVLKLEIYTPRGSKISKTIIQSVRVFAN